MPWMYGVIIVKELLLQLAVSLTKLDKDLLSLEEGHLHSLGVNQICEKGLQRVAPGQK